MEGRVRRIILNPSMRIAALYDIHANLPALEAVLEELRHAKVDQIVVGGDVLPGPMPVETMERLRELDISAQFIVGNGDREVLAATRGSESKTLPQFALDAIRWNAERLGEQHKQWLASWPKTLTLEIDGLGKVLFCHATPRDDNEIFTRLTAEDRLLSIFAGLDAAVVVCGHTHMQFDRQVGNVRVVNAGSVGMRFGEPGADWLLLGPASVELRFTPYDVAKADACIRATGYPQTEAFDILRPPDAAKMLELYARAELK